MNRFVLLAATAATLAVAGCEEPTQPEIEVAPPPLESVEAPSAEDQGVPATATAPTTPPVDTLPPEERSSEETVQPESETLFY